MVHGPESLSKLLNKIKRKRPSDLRPQNESFDTDTSSPEQKMSRKDHHHIHTMQKFNETVDKNTLKASKE
jgi:hypothetical protein